MTTRCRESGRSGGESVKKGEAKKCVRERNEDDENDDDDDHGHTRVVDEGRR